MSARLTFGTVKQVCARVLNLTASDARVAEYVNMAQERLMDSGKWAGTVARYRVCVTESCLTWPREIQTIEGWALDKTPGAIRGGWFEFLGSGPGIMDETSGSGSDLFDRGEACSFNDPVGGATKVFSIFCYVNETTTTPIILQFYDANGNWVRTSSGGSYIDGEAITIPTTSGVYQDGVVSIAQAGLVRVIKPKTLGRLLLYEKDTATATYRLLADYQPSETIPNYRRSLIPGLVTLAQSGDCAYKSVTVRAKLRHIDVEADNDFLIIGNKRALRLECQAIKKEENNLIAEAERYHGQALRILNEQLQSYTGDGEEQPIAVTDSSVYGPGVENLL